MSVYSGKPVTIGRNIADIYAKVSDLGQYREMIENLPEDVRARAQGVEFRGDALRMEAPGVGELLFKVTERTAPTHVGLSAEGSPIPLKLSIDLADVDGASTKVTPRIDIQIPPMLRPFIGNKLQEAADHFGSVFTSLFTA